MVGWSFENLLIKLEYELDVHSSMLLISVVLCVVFINLRVVFFLSLSKVKEIAQSEKILIVVLKNKKRAKISLV